MVLVTKEQAKPLVPNGPVRIGIFSGDRMIYGDYRRRDALKLIENAYLVNRGSGYLLLNNSRS